MLKLKAVGKKGLLLIGGVLVLLALAGMAAFILLRDDQKTTEEKKDLTGTLTTMPTPATSGPDLEYANNLAGYIQNVTNLEEKAKGYKILADAYRMNGKFKEALDAYKKTKELEQYGNFTQDEKNAIDASITALTQQVSDIEKAEPNSDPYKEPDE